MKEKMLLVTVDKHVDRDD